MSTLTNERLGEVAIALLLAEFDGIPSEQLPEALKELEVELVALGICTSEEATAVPRKVLEVIQKTEAQLFSRRYPPEVLESIKQLRAREGANTPSH